MAASRGIKGGPPSLVDRINVLLQETRLLVDIEMTDRYGAGGLGVWLKHTDVHALRSRPSVQTASAVTLASIAIGLAGELHARHYSHPHHGHYIATAFTFAQVSPQQQQQQQQLCQRLAKTLTPSLSRLCTQMASTCVHVSSLKQCCSS